jgi:transcriptional regulator with XRE-family HTH domain
MATNITFGTWLKKRRRHLDLTQNELAEQASCSVDMVRKIERDVRRPSKQLAELIAETLNIPQDQQ